MSIRRLAESSREFASDSVKFVEDAKRSAESSLANSPAQFRRSFGLNGSSHNRTNSPDELRRTLRLNGSSKSNSPTEMRRSVRVSARELRKRAMHSWVDAYRMDDLECLTIVRKLTIEMENVSEYLKVPYLVIIPSVVFSIIRRIDGDQSEPKQIIMRAKLDWNNRKINFFRADRNEEKPLFTIGLPAKEEYIEEYYDQKYRIGTMKNHGVEILHIDQPSGESDRKIKKTGLKVTKSDQSEWQFTNPYLTITPKTSLKCKVASATGVAFHNTKFRCFYTK